MPLIILIAGMDDSERAAIIRLLAGRGYRIGAVVSRADDAELLVDDEARAYRDAGASCVSIIGDNGVAAVLRHSVLENSIQGLFPDCHIVLADRDMPGCTDIIESIAPEAAPRYAGDRRLRAVIGGNVTGPDVVCFDHGMHDKVCDFIEERYLKPQLSAAILAGGKSQRLGTNKATLTVNSSMLIEHIIQTAKQFTDTVRIIANDQEPYRHFNIPIAADIMLGGGPLSGIHAALSLSATDYVLVLSCDMPLLSAEDIRPLIRAYPGFDITLYKHQKFEPLCAVYRRTCIGALEDLIRHGEYRIIDLFPTLNVKVIRTDDPTPYTSINTWEDYQRIIGGKGGKELRG